MHLHCNAATSPKIRLTIATSLLSCRALAQIYQISPSTVSRWKRRHIEDLRDRSSRPHTVRGAMGQDCKAIALRLRKEGFTLDECLESIRLSYPSLSRATLHRFLEKEGLGNLRRAKAPQKKFKDYEPGFIHVDSFQLPTLEGQKRYCYLAIDRATRTSFLASYLSRDKQVAVDFLNRLVDFFPFKIHRLLTDNGGEYTNRFYKPEQGGAKTQHPFPALCKALGIEHRLIQPYTPQTNGAVERLVRTVKQATVKKTNYDSPKDMVAALHTWMNTYNQHRKHGGIQRKTPLEQAQRWYKERPELFTRNPATICEPIERSQPSETLQLPTTNYPPK